MMHKAWCGIEDMPYYFSGHPSNFKVTRAKNRRFESNLIKITRPVAAIKSLRFVLYTTTSVYSFRRFQSLHRYDLSRSHTVIFSLLRDKTTEDAIKTTKDAWWCYDNFRATSNSAFFLSKFRACWWIFMWYEFNMKHHITKLCRWI